MAFQYGITPARAGKRISLSREPSMRRDHPRVGGEKLSCCVSTLAGKGSPPRGRGKVPRFVACAGRIGITPAWAGKSGARAWS